MIYLYRKIKQKRARDAEQAAQNAGTSEAPTHAASGAETPSTSKPAAAAAVAANTTSSEAQQSQPQQPSSRAVWRRRLKLVAAVLLPVFLETLDYTVVATSQSNIASVFNRLDLQSYIGTAYVLGGTVFIPIFASLADVFGRLWAMQLSVVIFLIGSAISTGAISMPALLVGRGIAGVGSAGLLTIVRIILSDSASIDDNNTQGALMIIVYSVGYSLGPVLGGLLLHANWRWVFAINLPICVASIILMAILLPRITKGPQPPQRLRRLPPQLAAKLSSQIGTSAFSQVARLDLVGATLFIIFGILVLLGLNWGSTEKWNQVKVIVCLVIGAVFLVIFVVWEYIVDHSTDHLAERELHGKGSPQNTEDLEASGHTGEKTTNGNSTHDLGSRARLARMTPKFARITDPMLPINMFRSYDVVASNWATMVSGMIMLGIFYFVAIFFVIVSGKDAVTSGVQLLYFAPGIGCGVIISIQLIKHLRQPRYGIWLSSLVLPIAVGFLAQALYTNNSAQIAGFMAMAGAGVGLGFGPLSYQARFSQPEDRVAIVIATNLFFRTFGGVIGLAQLSAVMYSRITSYITDAAYSGRIPPQQIGQLQQALSSVNGQAGGILGLPDQLREVITDAFRDGLRWAFLSLLPWLGLSFFLCLFLSRIPDERLNVPAGQLVEQPKEVEPERTPIPETKKEETV